MDDSIKAYAHLEATLPGDYRTHSRFLQPVVVSLPINSELVWKRGAGSGATISAFP